MSNLLKDASILLTPTGYDNGSMNAIKPENGDGDFQFSRNSAATRVNAQGLVENVQILSSNLVSNGDFSQEGAELVTNGNFATDSDWTKQTSWSISGDSANYDFLSDSKYIRQTLLNGGLVAGKTYKINFEITSGTAYMNVNSNGGGLISLNTYSVGSYSIYVTPSISASDLLFYGRNTSGTAFSITNISVKEVGQDWVLGTGWSIGDDKAVANTTGNFVNLYQNSTFVVGKTYKTTFTISDCTQGFVRLSQNGYDISGFKNVLGTYTNYFTASQTDLYVQGYSSFIGSITNISVIEITDDTNLPRINYEGFSYQDSLGSELIVNGDFATDTNWIKQNGWSISGGNAIAVNVPNTLRLQSNGGASVIGKTYKYSFEASNISGFYTVYIYGLPVLSSINTEGLVEGTFVATSTNGAFYISGATVNGLAAGKFDNVSVKEILGQEVVPNSGCGNWLLEPQSTNRMTDSEPTSGGAGFTFPPKTWANGLINGLNASEATSGIKYWYMSTGIANEYSTFSFFVEMEDGSEPMIGSSSDASSDFAVMVKGRFLLEYEIIKTNTIGNVWKIEATSRVNELAGTGAIGILKYIGQSNKTFSATGFQIEQQSYATSYIPTQGAASTRLQDIANNSGNASNFGSEGVLFAEISALVDDGTLRSIAITDGTVVNIIVIRYNSYPGGSAIDAIYLNNGVLTSAAILYSGSTDFTKIALSYQQGALKLYVNGILERSVFLNINNTINWNTLQFDIGNRTQDFYGNVRQVAVYKTALTDEQLTLLTTI